ncbi:hypothetical protein BXZ70DRAFT_1010578 [Cristinia sonorae]|uniref:Uncharacterized protein n=1 Tax=Cristinia sonorae TaxID=1940300 RepID=A0A8K0UJG9_9AGAR|nr:hypothetical protein BXZ70DRAFT_1010578 [Cristinia sonorae]
MFFSKFFVPAVALLSAAAGVFASPIAEPAPVNALIEKRGGQDVYNACQHVYDSCHPHIVKITPHAPTVDVVAAVDAIVAVFVQAEVDLAVFVGVDISAQIVAIVNIHIKLLTELFLALKACVAVNASILAKIDIVLKAYLAILARINASLCGKIGAGLPILVQLYINLKLTLCVSLLGLLNISIGINL